MTPEASMNMLPIPTDALELDAVRTADRFGHFMPSHCGPAQADRLIAAGYAAPDPEVGGWPRLTTAARMTRNAIPAKEPSDV